jgi:uncharacterized cupin superfamily protein
VVPEAELTDTGPGLIPAGTGWFVLNARDARWFHRPGRESVSLTGCDEFEAETYFPMAGVSIQVLEPGEANAIYHWEPDQEDFLVLHGEALLIVEGQERPLRRWDFVHCPPGTRHVFVGAGDGPCVLLAASSRELQTKHQWGYYVPDATAARYGASPPVETQDSAVAYANVPASERTRYRDGVLPD